MQGTMTRCSARFAKMGEALGTDPRGRVPGRTGHAPQATSLRHSSIVLAAMTVMTLTGCAPRRGAESEPPPDLIAGGDLVGAWAMAVTAVEVIGGEVIGGDGSSASPPALSGEHLGWRRPLRLTGPAHHPTDPTDPDFQRLERDPWGRARYLEATVRLVSVPEKPGSSSPGSSSPSEVPTHGPLSVTDPAMHQVAAEAPEDADTSPYLVIFRLAFARLNPEESYLPRAASLKELELFGGSGLARGKAQQAEEPWLERGTELLSRISMYQRWHPLMTEPSQAETWSDGRPFTCPGAPLTCTYDDDGAPVRARAEVPVKEEDIPVAILKSEDPLDTTRCRCGQGYRHCTEPCFFVSDGSPVQSLDPLGEREAILRPAERALAPLVYHLHGAPDWALATLRQAAGITSELLMEAAWLAAGCPPDAFPERLEAGCDARPEASDPHFAMVELCQEGDQGIRSSPLLRQAGAGVRPGDPRHHHILWVDEPFEGASLGRAPALVDPLTGRIRSATVVINGALLEALARQARYMTRLRTDSNISIPSLYHSYHSARTPAVNARAVDSAGQQHLRPRAAGGHPYPGEGDLSALAQSGLPETWVCQLCCNDESRDEDGHCQGWEGCLGKMAESTWRWSQDLRCGETIERVATDRLLLRVLLHEMGHNLGLTHNLRASTDAANYGDAYWRIRAEHLSHSERIRPRALQPETSAERLEGIRRHMTSSLMDLGGWWEPRPGYWDRAAVMSRYAGFRQVFTQI